MVRYRKEIGHQNLLMLVRKLTIILQKDELNSG